MSDHTPHRKLTVTSVCRWPITTDSSDALNQSRLSTSTQRAGANTSVNIRAGKYVPSAKRVKNCNRCAEAGKRASANS